MRAIEPTVSRKLVSRDAVFAGCFFLTGVAQTITMTVLPLTALRLLGNPDRVSYVYAVVGGAGFFGRLAVPLLCQLLGRFGVLVLGAAVLCLAVTALALANVALLVLGLTLNVFAVACFEIVLNLCVLERIPRSELARFEGKRIFVSAAPYTFGPWLGVHLQLAVADWVPFAVSGSAAVVLLALVWHSGLAAGAGGRLRESRSVNPLLALHRFFVQPRLRLAWALAAARSAWWALFQIYTPIFAVQAGLGEEVGGILVSIGLGWIWTVPLWGWVGRTFGQRRLLMAGYAAGGILSILAALLMGVPWLGAILLLVAALGTETIDGAGNTLFLRAVHPYERSTMTAVFITYRDFAQLAPPIVVSALLAVFALPAVFVGGGAMMLGAAALSRHIPRRF